MTYKWKNIQDINIKNSNNTTKLLYAIQETLQLKEHYRNRNLNYIYKVKYQFFSIHTKLIARTLARSH